MRGRKRTRKKRAARFLDNLQRMVRRGRLVPLTALRVPVFEDFQDVSPVRYISMIEALKYPAVVVD